MTTRCTGYQAARRIGFFLLLIGAGRGATAWETDEIAQKHAQKHASQGQSAPWQKSTCSQREHWPMEDADLRAGDPRRVAWWAKPSRNKRDAFGYIGGNASWRGEPRLPDEGTWGLDYAGLFSKNHIWLKWLHHRPSHQAGGSYNTDGPHFLSN